MKFRHLIKSVVLLMTLVPVVCGALLLLSPTVHLDTKSVGEVQKPDFAFDVVWEEAATGYNSARRAILVISKRDYTESNIRQVFLWYSRLHSQDDLIVATLFTVRNKAVPDEFLWPRLSWRRTLNLVAYDAWYFRFRHGLSNAVVDEDYEYRLFTWLPFWTKRVILEDGAEVPPTSMRRFRVARVASWRQ